MATLNLSFKKSDFWKPVCFLYHVQIGINGIITLQVVRNVRDLLSNILLKPGSSVSPDQFAEGIIQSGLYRDHTASLGYLSPCMIVLVGQSIFLISSLNLCFNICLLSLILWHMLSLAPVPWGTLCKDWKAAVRSHHSLPFCRLSKPHSPPSAQSSASSPSHFSGFCSTPGF